jgi:hypothetical protein
MSTNNAKRMAAKPKRSAPAEQKRGAPVNGGGPEGPSGRFWTRRIEPKGAVLLSENLRPCHLVVKNHGAYNILLVAQYGDLMDLAPGDVRATCASGTIGVENKGEESVLIEFEIVPLTK